MDKLVELADTLYQEQDVSNSAKAPVTEPITDPVWENFKDEYKDRTLHFIDKNG